MKKSKVKSTSKSPQKNFSKFLIILGIIILIPIFHRVYFKNEFNQPKKEMSEVKESASDRLQPMVGEDKVTPEDLKNGSVKQQDKEFELKQYDGDEYFLKWTEYTDKFGYKSAQYDEKDPANNQLYRRIFSSNYRIAIDLVKKNNEEETVVKKGISKNVAYSLQGNDVPFAIISYLNNSPKIFVEHVIYDEHSSNLYGEIIDLSKGTSEFSYQNVNCEPGIKNDGTTPTLLPFGSDQQISQIIICSTGRRDYNLINGEKVFSYNYIENKLKEIYSLQPDLTFYCPNDSAPYIASYHYIDSKNITLQICDLNQKIINSINLEF